MYDWREHKKIIDKFILPQIKKIIYLIIVILLGIIASMAIPYVFGNIIDLIVIKDLQLVLKFTLISLFLNIFQSLSSILEEWIGNILSIDCSNSIKEVMFSKILDTRYEFLNSYGEGELVSRIENTGEKIVGFYIELFSSIVMIIFSIIISAYIMIRISLKLFIIAIILLPLTYGINHIFKSTIISKQRDYIAKLDAYSDYLIDTISNLTGIKLNNLERIFKGNYKNKLQDLKNVSMSNLKINMTVTSIQDLITIILSSLILFISARLIILGNLTLGNIVAFSSYMEKLHSSIKKIGDLNLSFNEVIVDLERYREIMDHDNEKKIDGKKLSKITSLKFKNVSFKYDDEYILKDFSFEISKPGLYAIVGENGSGKTTIFNLISKLYTNYEGEILINDNEISDIKDEDLRDEVLFIESKPFILRENLNSNITLLEKNKVDEPYLEKITQFLELERIEKYSTKNLKDTLSKGEQQKIQLARMMIGRYSLILLDEVLSGLDQEIKKKAISKIKEKSKNNIVVMISHDHEIQKICDDIFLMVYKNSI
ncbi:ABC transporter transmembrane domain-containing protein [Anaerococcus hydrogenalis]|uniref:ABC transporter, ATP-binding protein n=1 Tax=Anaerococcus hydrogenalis ACS-025-V-Sch4 TaxID=879306 RepID=F0H2T0_9FIRM|nr:ABC transporter ATP-binding protein [Anaerococcus hydrogenalis]EGC83261.1 ABC transporter, ATP-binding protein [Anaerococcus hydrogenalis ACS-025-V-Sch4]HEQ5508939.1 ABC transporter ATP-binding protein [Streptococcus pyogenes]